MKPTKPPRAEKGAGKAISGGLTSVPETKQVSAPSKPLPCVCGHEKEMHGKNGMCLFESGVRAGYTESEQFSAYECPCEDYHPCIPLKDLRALLEAWDKMELTISSLGDTTHCYLKITNSHALYKFNEEMRKLRELEGKK